MRFLKALVVLLVLPLTLVGYASPATVETVGYGIYVAVPYEVSYLVYPDGTRELNSKTAYYTAPGNGTYTFDIMDKKGTAHKEVITLDAECMVSFDIDGDGKHDTVVEIRPEYSAAELRVRTVLSQEMKLVFPGSYAMEGTAIINSQAVIPFSKSPGVAHLKKEGTLKFYIAHDGQQEMGELTFTYRGGGNDSNTTSPVTTPKEGEVVPPVKELPKEPIKEQVTKTPEVVEEVDAPGVFRIKNQNSVLDGAAISKALRDGLTVEIILTEQSQKVSWSLAGIGVPDEFKEAHLRQMQRLLTFLGTNPTMKEANDFILNMVLDTVDRVATVGEESINPYTGGSLSV